MKASEFLHGMRVRYVPGHAFGDITSPQCEDGTVSSNNGKNVFVKFDKQVLKLGWGGTTSQACSPEDLVHEAGNTINPQTYFASAAVENQALNNLYQRRFGGNKE